MSARRSPSVAYFCMEYGLNTEMKTYSGGLGILAGDFMKAAHDLKQPIIGIGIKWRQGYIEQQLTEDGMQKDCFQTFSYSGLKPTGVTVYVTVRKTRVAVKVWKCDQYGTNPLYLLDTDLPENGGSDRFISSQLYGGFSEMRIAQEMVLGIGGVRALRELELPIEVYHFNEGHAVLAALELIKERMSAGLSFEEAWLGTRAEVVFTTHTPIAAGNEAHELDLLEFLNAFNGLSREQMIRLGGEPFNMTVAALRLSRRANAVAELHCQTAQKMWKTVAGRSEIIGITNAVHSPTWVDSRMQVAYEKGVGIWETHQKLKQELLDYVKAKTGVSLALDKLLLGFSRRSVAYKRSDLIFTDPKAMGPYFESGELQIIFSGKAHPNDDSGKELIQRIVAMSKKYPKSVVFLENYDMTVGALLTRGVDVWLNNPRRPLEASGTSGMKAAMNGVLNCSTLDGWWPEACEDGINGWQFGDGYESENIRKHDLHDQLSMYKTLKERVFPTYYEKPEKWREMMRESIRSTRDKFDMKRMIHEYFEKLYHA